MSGDLAREGERTCEGGMGTWQGKEWGLGEGGNEDLVREGIGTW